MGFTPDGYHEAFKLEVQPFFTENLPSKTAQRVMRGTAENFAGCDALALIACAAIQGFLSTSIPYGENSYD